MPRVEWISTHYAVGHRDDPAPSSSSLPAPCPADSWRLNRPQTRCRWQWLQSHVGLRCVDDWSGKLLTHGPKSTLRAKLTVAISTRGRFCRSKRRGCAIHSWMLAFASPCACKNRCIQVRLFTMHVVLALVLQALFITNGGEPCSSRCGERKRELTHRPVKAPVKRK